MLVFSDGTDLNDFDSRCSQVSARCREIGDSINVDEFKSIFGDLGRYILIPHYDKKPSIDDETLKKFLPHVTSGEVSSPKKFMYCAKSSERLVCQSRRKKGQFPGVKLDSLVGS